MKLVITLTIATLLVQSIVCTVTQNINCTLPKLVGNCRAAFTRYWFNSTSQQCETFTYGGCGGNSNNFNSQDECEKACPKGQISTTEIMTTYMTSISPITTSTDNSNVTSADTSDVTVTFVKTETTETMTTKELNDITVHNYSITFTSSNDTTYDPKQDDDDVRNQLIISCIVFLAVFLLVILCVAVAVWLYQKRFKYEHVARSEYANEMNIEGIA
ncbi:hypothetical protein [Carp edema virus]|nr:hypothetical protein [Carp edema virus]